MKISEAGDAGTLLLNDKIPLARNGSTLPYAATLEELLSFVFSTPLPVADGYIGIATANAADGSQSVNLSSGNVTASNASGAANVFSGDNSGPGQTGYASLYSGNQTGSGDSGAIYVGSGNTGDGTTGQVALYTGDSSSGATGLIGISTGVAHGDDSGNIGIVTGESSTANSGNIELKTGNADGTRGHIIIDAPSFSAPSGFTLDSATNPISLTVSTSSADFGPGTDISLTAGPGGNMIGDGGAINLTSGSTTNGQTGVINIFSAAPSGDNGSGSILFQTGITPGAGTSGEVDIYSGNSAVGDSGNVIIGTGTAGGTRGSIVFDGPISATGGDYVTANSGTLPDMAHQTIVVTDATNLPGQSYSLTLGKLYADFFGEWYNNNPLDAAGGSGDNGMSVYIDAGAGDGVGDGGRIQLTTGGATGTGNSGALFLRTAAPFDAAASSGQIGVASGGTLDGSSGAISIATGDAISSGASGPVEVKTGNASLGDSSQMILHTGNAGTNSGNLTLQTGTAGGTRGNIVLDAADVILAGDASGYAFVDGAPGLNVVVTGGAPTSDTGNGRGCEIDGHNGGATSGNGGDVAMYAGVSLGVGDGGSAYVWAGSATDGNGGQVSIQSGPSASGDSGNITLQTGTASGTRGDISATANVISLVADDKIILDAQALICPNGNNFLELGTEGTGGVDVFTGSQTGTNVSGGVSVATGNTENAHTGGMQIFTGSASGDGYNSGSIGIYTGNPGVGGTRGSIVLDAFAVTSPSGQYLQFQTGDESAPGTPSQDYFMFTGRPGAGASSGAGNFGTGDGDISGDVFFYTGNAADGNSGNVNIQTGTATGTRGNIILDALRVLLLNAPTSDPHVVGALWVDTSAGRVVKCSAGP